MRRYEYDISRYMEFFWDIDIHRSRLGNPGNEAGLILINMLKSRIETGPKRVMNG